MDNCEQLPTAPTANQNEKAQRLDAIGGSTINDVAEGGTVAATCYPCPCFAIAFPAAVAPLQAHDAGRDVPTHTAATCAP